jgi:heme exporter protein D
MASTEPDPAPEPVPDPAKARSTKSGLMWTAAGLTGVVGVFQLSRVFMDAGGYDALAWLGVVLTVLCLLALVAAYVGCARDMLTLRTRLLSRIDLFQVTTVLALVAIVAGILVPDSNTTALALLLPWGLTYWLHNLNPAT